MNTYEHIANQIRENLFKEIDLRARHTAEEKRLWDEAFKVGPTDRAKAEELLKKAQGEEMEAAIQNKKAKI